MSTPAKEHHCALCGSANVARGRKYCPECLSAVRKTQAEEHNKKLKAQYEEKKKQALPQGNSSTMSVPEQMLQDAATASR